MREVGCFLRAGDIFMLFSVLLVVNSSCDLKMNIKIVQAAVETWQ